MARPTLNLARAKKLAAKVFKDDDSNVDIVVELFVKAGGKLTVEEKAFRNAILQTWYLETEHFRNSFRAWLSEFEESEDEAVEDHEHALESNALPS